MDSGVLCAMIGLVKQMLTLFADNWDMTELTGMIISQSEFYSIVDFKKLIFYNFLSSL